MIFEFNLGDRYLKYFSSQDIVYFKGHFYVDDDLYEGEEAAKKALELFPYIPEYGFFSFVLQKGDDLYLVSDKVGSSILYFYKQNSRVLVSDRITNTRCNFTYKINKFNFDEFLVAGFVTEGETLYEDIFSTQPGTMVRINSNTNEISKTVLYNYYSNTLLMNDDSDLINKHNDYMHYAIRRLVEYSKGRTLLLPLSGGLDSRLVARELKRNGVSDVICFTYGKKGNEESNVSKEVANKLGYRWIFIEYTRRKWNEVYKLKEFQDYINYSTNMHALSHIQDYIAVKEMKDLVPKNSVFVPGHTGDFISGGHILPVFGEQFIKEEKLVELIIKKHFRVNRFSSLSPDSQTQIFNKIRRSIAPLYKEKIDPAFIYEWYDWKERQQKHVLHSLRIYEYFEFDWYIPLWDTDLTLFWNKIGIDNKMNKSLYKKYLIETDINDVFSDLYRVKRENKVKNAIKEKKLFVKLNKYRRKLIILKTWMYKYVMDYYQHPLQWYGMFSYIKVIRVYRFQNIYSILVRDYLSKIKE